MRLLVVEDERRMADALARGLRAEGFVVDCAGVGVREFRLARPNLEDWFVSLTGEGFDVGH